MLFPEDTEKSEMALADIRKQVEALAAVIGAPPEHLPTYGESEDFARPHVELSENGYDLVVIERGQEQGRERFESVDGLLCEIFRSVTFVMASSWEAEHRIDGQDFRRLLMKHQLELLGRLNQAWAERVRIRWREALRQNPYVDE